MCGIAGILDCNQSRADAANRTALNRMLTAMSHRGPDDQGEEKLTSHKSALYLGHRRLSIIDLSSLGHQPMANDSKSIWVSTNGELYNFRELREELKHKYAFRSSTDTEVILRAYEEWGFDCLHRFRGMFAFCIWDASKQVLFLARDHLGVKPLYYHTSPGSFLFASEIRAIKASGILSTKIDPLGIYHYLSFGRLQSPHSILTGILELKPAHYLVVDVANGKTRENRYWNPFDNKSTITSGYQEQVTELISESIRLQMVSDVPLGAFLSGGIDSSAVTGILTRLHKLPVKTLSIVFNEKEFDESKYSELVASRFATDHHILRLDEGDLLKALPKAINAMDQPTIDGINTYLISLSARQAGLTVALSGLGGDELFCGYDSFKMVPKLLKLEGLLRSLPQGVQRMAGGLVNILSSKSDRNVKLAHFLAGKIEGLHPYFLFRALFCHDPLNELLAQPELTENGTRHLLESSAALMDSLKGLDIIDQISYLELTQYTANMLLRDTDVMSMAHALEVRVPLMDHKLVELMLSIPGYLKIDPKVQKHLLVQAVPGGLPEKAVFRKKMGFTLPFESWMRTKLKSEIEGVLLTPVASLTGILSEAGTKKTWDDFCAHKTTWARPWSLYILKRWAERNI